MENYVIENNFILRTPQRSFQSVAEPMDFNTETLKAIFSKSTFKESIFLASPLLYEEMEKWLKGELNTKKEADKLKASLFRYYARMSTRPTPYGLFAGCGLGTFANQTAINIDHNKVARHTRLDMNYLCALSQDLTRMPEIKPKLLFFPNSSIYEFGDKLRYVEFKYMNAKRKHHIVAVDNSEYLQKVISAAKKGAKTEYLAKLLVDDEISLEEASEFINQLIDNQILVSSLEPAVTGPEFTDQLLEVLREIPEAEYIVEVLEKVQRKIAEIDTKISKKNIKEYYEIARELENLETKYELKYLFQTDKFFEASSCSLNSSIKQYLQQAFELLNRISAMGENQNLKNFREAFYERYETKEVPLLEALDTEAGIGYLQTDSKGDITPLVDDLFIPPGEQGKTITANLGAMQQLLQKKINDNPGRMEEIVLDEEDLKDFKANADDLPHSVSAMINIFGEIMLDGEKKPLIGMNNAGNFSAVNLLGRFCHGNKDIFEFSKEITKKEQELSKDAILAEIVHLPESRTGNVLLRPTLRNFEIPYLAKSSVPIENQVTTDDIMVSVNMKQIFLRSKKFNKRIIPRMANAHNFSFNALPVYQFLCDVQHQGTRGIGFGWGDMKTLYSYLPRVRYKNIILAEASWKIQKQDISELAKAKDDTAILKLAADFREKFKLPEQVLLADSDNKLFINFNSPWSIKAFLLLVKNRSAFELEEFLFCEENALVKDETGAYTNEIIIAFTKSKE